jgi:hypothetical protein
MRYIIYKISIADYTYIGSTVDWKQRQIRHKCNFFNPNHHNRNIKLYQTIRENGGWDAIEKSPIEEFECDGATQAHIREEHWRREYDAQLNMRRAHQTIEERAQYRRDKNNQKIQCECGAIISPYSKYSHLRTKKHADNLAAQQNIPIL